MPWQPWQPWQEGSNRPNGGILRRPTPGSPGRAALAALAALAGPHTTRSWLCHFLIWRRWQPSLRLPTSGYLPLYPPR